MNYEKIRSSPKQFKALTSLTVEEFDALLQIFSPIWSSSIRHFTLSGKIRQQMYSPKSDQLLINDEQKLFFILYYYKNNPLQEAMAASFDMKQNMTNKLIHILMPLLHKSLFKWKPSPNGWIVPSKMPATVQNARFNEIFMTKSTSAVKRRRRA
jgi:Helix-turn-helix of DDE superfamily endonuclease